MISYFNTIINIIIITDPTFSSVNKFFVRIFFLSRHYNISFLGWPILTMHPAKTIQKRRQTTQNKPRQAKKRPKMSQSNQTQAKTSQKETKNLPERPKTSQKETLNKPKRPKSNQSNQKRTKRRPKMSQKKSYTKLLNEPKRAKKDLKQA